MKYDPEMPLPLMLSHVTTQSSPMQHANKLVKKAPLIIGQGDSEHFKDANYFVRFDVNLIHVGSFFPEALEIFVQMYCLFNFSVERELRDLYDFLLEIIDLKPLSTSTIEIIQKLSEVSHDLHL